MSNIQENPNIWRSVDSLEGKVWCVQWDPKGEVLASCGDDKSVKLWSRVKGSSNLQLSSKLSGSHSRTVRCVCFSPCGKYLASASFDAAIVIYELTDGDFEEANKLEGHESEVKCCAWSPSGQFLASCGRDKSVWFWEMDEDEDFQVSSILQSHTQDVKFVKWHPSEELLVSCSYDCSIRFYRYDGEDWITQQHISNAHNSTVWCADFSGDGDRLATVGADACIKIWQRQQQDLPAERCTWIETRNLSLGSRWPLYAISWNKVDGTIAVGGGDRILRLFKQDTSENGSNLVEVQSLRLPYGDINSCCWNPKEFSLLTLAFDGGTIINLDVRDLL
ncbi:hypothetical protein AB6A40_008263 [Gnathostoma spinigerum]|uniref:Probable cytosolic iron-sulfur protein assembly protein CIAO1 homolog n=1 Tax=Gnathostoma spinigerum TaxID=75299 RepID=A0ABD6ENJ8_9BILA